MRLVNRYLSVVLLLFFVSCSVQLNMTGASIHDSLKTIRIENFEDISGNGSADIGLKLTESLRDFFQTNSRLKILGAEDTEQADLVLNGDITGYDIISVGYTGDQSSESASISRLKVTVKATLESMIEIPDENYEVGYDLKSFSNTNGEFSVEEVFADREDDLVDEVVLQLAQDMFTKAFTSW